MFTPNMKENENNVIMHQNSSSYRFAIIYRCFIPVCSKVIFQPSLEAIFGNQAVVVKKQKAFNVWQPINGFFGSGQKTSERAQLPLPVHYPHEQNLLSISPVLNNEKQKQLCKEVFIFKIFKWLRLWSHHKKESYIHEWRNNYSQFNSNICLGNQYFMFSIKVQKEHNIP